MMFEKKYLFVVLSFSLFFAFPISVFSQGERIADSERGYYIKDGTRVEGIAFLNQNKLGRTKVLIIPQQIRHGSTTFYPSDISEYGFDNGLRYVSVEIAIDGQKKQVFLEQEYAYSDSLYLFSFADERKTYYLINRNTKWSLLSDSGEELWKLLREENNCAELTKIQPPKNLNAKTIKVYSDAYVNCNTKLFQKPSYGISGSVNMFSRTVDYETSSDLYPTISAGVFGQLPIDQYFVVRLEANYIYMFLNDAYVALPKPISFLQGVLVARCHLNYLNGNIIPYIDFGGCVDWRLQKAELRYFATDLRTQIGVNELLKLENKTHYGFILGGGLRFKLQNGHSIYAGLRATFTYAGTRETKDRLNVLGANLSYGF